ncbi:hypothetical protein [Mesorhizobium sp. J428]|uniref:hypothetical protein n=1 Tax=Mesorhizobium sp. J428 TaxID=2898440 RepID=UPI0021512C72|nr:hypothetical protein [Mesorhizobium sp. J428]MCR5860053.1 hypothetical protein [Mesorhizobium sp. J428]
MFTFGTSAYLKMISLNAKPQRTEVRKRLIPSDDPYDFHRSLRPLANRMLAKGEDVESVFESASRISATPERNSVQAGLRTLLLWRDVHTADLFEVKPHTHTSPQEIFRVKFTADFGTIIDGKRCGVHLWNTKKPVIDARFSTATLSIIREFYPELDGLAVLSLIDSSLIWSSDETAYADLGRRLMTRLENVILSVEEEIRDSGRDRPSPPSHPTPII